MPIGFCDRALAEFGGHYPAIAYKITLALNLALQIAALAYFVSREARVISFANAHRAA
jgi:hypothetical protein